MAVLLLLYVLAYWLYRGLGSKHECVTMYQCGPGSACNNWLQPDHVDLTYSAVSCYTIALALLAPHHVMQISTQWLLRRTWPLSRLFAAVAVKLRCP